VTTAAVLQVAAVPFPVLGAGWARPHPELYPLDLLPELRAYEQSRPKGTPIFNDMFFGGFLIYHTPELRIFVDDRCELYGDDWLEHYAEAVRSHPDEIETWARQYGFDHALVQAHCPFDNYLATVPERWTEIKRTDTAVLYRRLEEQPPAR
jgi:hypothetical protein